MNDGVKILLERMNTHPEEFEGTALSTKWGQLIRLYEDYLEPEDRQALTQGVNKIMQQHFTEKVMEELVDPKEPSLEELMIMAKEKAMRMRSAGKTPIQYTADKLETLERE